MQGITPLNKPNLKRCPLIRTVSQLDTLWGNRVYDSLSRKCRFIENGIMKSESDQSPV